MLVEPITVDKAFIDEMNTYSIPESSGLLEASSKNHIVFSEKMLGFPLRAWQKKASLILMRIVNEPDPVVQRKLFKKLVLITSRQIGKSEWVASAALWLCAFNKYPGRIEANPSKATMLAMISITDEQARKLLRRTRKMLRRADRFIARTYVSPSGVPLFGSSFFEDLLDDKEPNNTQTLTFKAWNPSIHGQYVLRGAESGTSIACLPPTGKALGETYSVIFVDEAGRGDYMTDDFHNNDLYPVGDALDAIRIYTSTPWQSSGFFYKMVNPDGLFPDDPSTIVLCFTIEAIRLEAPEHYDTIMQEIERRRLSGENDEVNRAYYCRFVKGESSYFDPAKVMDAFNPGLRMQESFAYECDMGVDFGGQQKSKTVVTISEKANNGTIVRVYHRAYEVGKDLTLLEDIADLLKRFNVQRIIPDDCPAGFFLINQMKDKGWNVHPMNFRAEKVKKYGSFRAMLNKGRVQSYSDIALQREMLAMEFSQAAKQSVLQHAPGESDDLIDSFVMSAYFYVEDEVEFKVHNLIEFEYDEDPYATKKTSTSRFRRNLR